LRDSVSRSEQKLKKGENKSKGGDKFSVEINGPNGPVENLDYKDIGDGSYHVHYNLSEPGDYQIFVKMDGKDIKGSPWKQTI